MNIYQRRTMNRRGEDAGPRTLRYAIPNQPKPTPRSAIEAAKIEYSKPRENDAAYKSFLRHGANSRNGIVKASESGAWGMANQGEQNRIKRVLKVGETLKRRKMA